ncbi:unnamed protein product, partial [Rotaria magnacalcarata]
KNKWPKMNLKKKQVGNSDDFIEDIVPSADTDLLFEKRLEHLNQLDCMDWPRSGDLR